MNAKRALKPSPLVGEGGAPARSAGAPGEGASRARSLRTSMTDAERKLWFALRARGFAGAKFRRQVPIGPYIADFACYEAKLVIEVDGGQHAGSVRDVRRDRWLSANGFKTLRFWNNEVLQNLDGVLQRVAEALATPHPARASRGHPSPTRGEGKRRVAR